MPLSCGGSARTGAHPRTRSQYAMLGSSGSLDATTTKELAEQRETSPERRKRLRFRNWVVAIPDRRHVPRSARARTNLLDRFTLTWIVAPLRSGSATRWRASLPVDSVAIVTTQDSITPTGARTRGAAEQAVPRRRRVVAFDIRFQAPSAHDAVPPRRLNQPEPRHARRTEPIGSRRRRWPGSRHRRC